MILQILSNRDIIRKVFEYWRVCDVNIESCVNSLSMALPEDILKRKWAGDLEGAIRAIDMRLKRELPDMLRARLVCERERIRRLPTQYPWNREQALAKFQEIVPDMTSELMEELELGGWVDFIYVGGEKRYFVRFHKAIVKSGVISHMTGAKREPANPYLDPMMDEIIEKGEMRRRITLKTSVYVDEDDFVSGHYLVHLPVPAVTAQQSDVQILEGDPDGVADVNAEARAAWWDREVDQWRKFGLTYSFISHIRYADPLGKAAPDQELYPNVEPPCAEDLGESGAYLRFTPYLKDLAAKLIAGETDPLQKAWKIYEFVTTKITYSFVRDYFQFDNHGEFCAVNLKGDCGLQALLFIILCRIAGIPARWQSGMSIDPDYVGGHDWAQFYLEGWGWLFADCSYGGSAYRAGNAKRHRFYFGNLDPMRMAANRKYQAELLPCKKQLRGDPFDNQSGEMEREGAPLPFTVRQLNGDAQLISVENL